MEEEVEPVVQAMGQAFRCGIAPDIFWSLTPFILNQAVFARNESAKDEVLIGMQLSLMTGWHGANYNRAKDLPSLEGDLRKLVEGPIELTPEQSVDQMRTFLNASKVAAKQRGAR